MVNFESITEHLSNRSTLESRLPRLSSIQAEVVSQAAARLPIVQLNDQDCWTLALCHDNEPLTDDTWTFSVSIACAGVVIDVALSSLLVNTLINGILSDMELQKAPYALRTAALTKALDPVLDFIESGLGHPVTLSDSGKEPVAPSISDLLIRVENGNTDVIGFARIRVTDKNARLLKTLLKQHAVKRTPWMPAVFIPITVGLPEMSLGMEEFFSLRCGDVLRTEATRGDNMHPFYINNARAGIAWRTNQGQYLLKEIRMTNRRKDIEEDEERFDDDSELPIEKEAVSVTLRFELGQARMNISDLLNLSVGQMLEIPDSSVGSIKIRANGSLIGKGELIAIGKELGVRLVELRDGNQQRAI